MRKSLASVMLGLMIVTLVLTAVSSSSSTPAPIDRFTGPVMHILGQYDGPPQPLPPLDPALVAEGAQLYAKYCAACHGINLEGQPDWKIRLPNGRLPTPPHDDSGHTWHHGDMYLYKVLFEGGNGLQTAEQTGMPGFVGIIDGREALAIISFIKSRWSLENQLYQWEMTQTGH